MKLRDIIDLKKGDIVSIVGAGGKTTLMFTLGKECGKSKVLLTTSTKIFKPDSEGYDYLACNTLQGQRFKLNKNPGIYVFGSDINEENKLIGIDNNILEDFSDSFDYIFIESDGSKMKPIKGWGENEPVILNGTTKTVGVINIKIINKYAKVENVHRLEEFMNITGLDINEKIGIQEVSDLILHRSGLFKVSMGERILFINQVENEDDINRAYLLAEEIKKLNPNYIDKIIAGSLKDKKYMLIK